MMFTFLDLATMGAIVAVVFGWIAWELIVS